MNKILGIILALVMLCGAAVLFITDRVLDHNLEVMIRSVEYEKVYGNSGGASAPDRVVGDEFRKAVVSDF